MPNAEHYPRWGKTSIRGAVTVIYLVTAALAGGAAYDPPAELVARVGLTGTVDIAVLTSTTAAAAGLAHAFHKWLIERATVPFALTGVVAFAALLWSGVPAGIADPFTAGLVVALAAAIFVRVIELEVFRQQHRPPRRRRRVKES